MEEPDKIHYFIHPKDGDDTNIGTSEDAPLETTTGLAIAVLANKNPWIAVCYWWGDFGRYIEL